MATPAFARVATSTISVLPKTIHTRKVGVVVSAGKMMKTVKVRIAKQRWDNRIKKAFPDYETVMVSDPNSSSLEGDVVSIESGWRTSKEVRHVLTAIVSPMGPPIAERPPVPSRAERLAEAEMARAAKDARQAARGRQVAVARERQRSKEAKHAEWLRSRNEYLVRGQLGGIEPRDSAQSRFDSIETEVQFLRGRIEGLSVPEGTGLGLASTEVEPRQDDGQAKLSAAPRAQGHIEQESSQPTTATLDPQTSATIQEAAFEAQTQEQRHISTGETQLEDSLPGGEHPVGDINQRALHNKRKALNEKEKQERNEEELKAMEKEVEGTVNEERKQGGGWLSSLFRK